MIEINEYDLIGTNHDIVTYEGTKIDLYFYNPEDVPNINPEYQELYQKLFRFVSNLANELGVECPALSIRATITQMDPETKILSRQSACSYSKYQYPTLKRTVILLALEDMHNSDLYLMGVLAHELRHCWQDINRPEIREKNASGYFGSLTDEAEIDADAYAIFFLANHQLGWDFDRAADIMCPFEKAHDPDAYAIRLERGKTYCTTLPKLNFIEKLIMKLIRKE